MSVHLRAAAVRLALGLLLAALAALAGCGSIHEGRFDPALFGREAAAAPPQRLPGRVALRVQPAVQDKVIQGRGAPAAGVRLPVGRIVEEAMAAALEDSLRDGVLRGDGTAAAAAGPMATLVVESVHVAHDSRLLWFVPLPVFPFAAGDTEIGARLAFDLSLLDAPGRTVWTRSYDSGREIYHRPSFWSSERLPDGLLRMAHASAWRLAQQAAADLRQWLQAERGRERDL